MLEHFQEYLALYMFPVLAILLFSGLPVAFVLGGVAVLFATLAIAMDMMNISELYLFVERAWQSGADNLVLTAIPGFIFMGTLLERSKVAGDLLNILQRLLQQAPGSLALAVTLMGTIMAATTGIIGASVVMMTLMALPTMLQQRYAPSFATGSIAASATLGILLPPSIMLVVMADLLTISVGNLFIAAIIPGLVLAVLYMVYVVVAAKLNPTLAPKTVSEHEHLDGKALLTLLLKGFLPPVFLIALVLGSIFGGWATPTEAAGIGAFGAIVLSAIKGKFNFALLHETCQKTAMTTAMIFFIIFTATAFSYVFRALWGEEIIVDFIQSMDLGAWSLLLSLMLTIFILGFFFDWIEITLIVLPVFAPIVALLDFGEHVVKAEILYWFAILAAINLQTSFLTPPFGAALFYMKGTARARVKLQDIYRGIVPFVMLQLFGLAVILIWPELALWLPRQLME
ncbi:C4-dicarboxylate TRAP transporter large permease protein DctM [Thalassocella blandensis]|nr:C4-dicarboxylate TRAP transporter large permease protein DctM [Thalassocella blandensis]